MLKTIIERIVATFFQKKESIIRRRFRGPSWKALLVGAAISLAGAGLGNGLYADQTTVQDQFTGATVNDSEIIIAGPGPDLAEEAQAGKPFAYGLTDFNSGTIVIKSSVLGEARTLQKDDTYADTGSRLLALLGNSGATTKIDITDIVFDANKKTFTHSNAGAPSYGASYIGNFGELTLSNVTFTGGGVEGSAGMDASAGGLYVTDGNTVLLTDTSFTDNFAESTGKATVGGGVRFDNISSLTLQKSSGNLTAPLISTNTVSLTVVDDGGADPFSAEASGGGLAVFSGTALTDDVTSIIDGYGFYGNSVLGLFEDPDGDYSVRGGGILIYTDGYTGEMNNTITGTTVTQNTATSGAYGNVYGGGIALFGSVGVTTIDDTTRIEGNRAAAHAGNALGGGLYLNNLDGGDGQNVTLNLNGTTIDSNTTEAMGNSPNANTIGASAFGGGVAIEANIGANAEGTVTLVLDDAKFLFNEALADGNGTDIGYAHGGGLSINNGGSVTGVVVKIADATFEGNIANSAEQNAVGGGIWLCNTVLGNETEHASGLIMTDNIVQASAGNALGGGIAFVGETGNSYLNSSTFTGNKAISDVEGNAFGGGIFFDPAAGSVLRLYDVSFDENEANTATGNAEGGAIRSSRSVFIAAESDDVKFSENKADVSVSGHAAGGAIWTAAALNFYKSDDNGITFSENTASTEIGSAKGGAVVVLGSTEFSSDATFERNSATTEAGSAYGGAFFGTSHFKAGAQALEFTGNTAEGTTGAYGGAIAIDTLTASNLTIGDGYNLFIGSGSSFEGNEAITTGGDALGGAIFIGSDKEADTSNPQNNKNVGEVTLTGTTFSVNNATSTGGSARGGAITIDAIVREDSSPFIDYNTGTVTFGKYDSGAISEVVKFIDNTVSTTGSGVHARGGAINVMGVKTFAMFGGKFTGNTATYDGAGGAGAFAAAGAAYFGQYAYNLISFSETTFDSNTAKVTEDVNVAAAGGAVRIVTGAGHTTAQEYSTTATFDGMTFTGNAAIATLGDATGGAVDLRGSVDAVFRRTTFGGSDTNNQKNRALSDNGAAMGGAILFSQDGITTSAGSLTIVGDFIKNIASGVTAFGGAIYSDVATTFQLQTSFTDNEATATGGNAFGGAIFSSGKGMIIWDKTGNDGSLTFTGNKATAFDGNAFGGALYSTGVGLSLTGDDYDFVFDFIGNVATATGKAQGGAVWSDAVFTMPTRAHTFSSNRVTSIANADLVNGYDAFGGALALVTMADGTARDVTISAGISSGNSATATVGDAYGGAIGIGGDVLNVDLDIAKNLGTINLSNFVFMANQTEGKLSGRGGAVDIEGYIKGTDGKIASSGTVNITNVEFGGYTDNIVNEDLGNTATGGSGNARGGALQVLSAKEVNIDGGFFAGNTALREGDNGVTVDYAAGGAIYFGQYDSATINIDGTTFEGNVAKNEDGEAGGGAIRINSIMTNANTTDAVTTATFTADFKNNTAMTAGGVSLGGAVDLRGAIDATFTGSDFTGNKVDFSGSATTHAYGGAIHASADGLANADLAKLTITGTGTSGNTFGTNSAYASANAYGGAVYSGVALTLDGTLTFSANIASGISNAYGGAIYDGAGMTFASGAYLTFADNMAEAFNGEAFGGAIYSKSSVDLSGVTATFTENSASNTSSATGAYGGAIVVDTITSGTTDLDLKLGAAIFTENEATAANTTTGADALGGAIYIGASKLASDGTGNVGDVELIGTVFDTNRATAETGNARGGAITIDAIVRTQTTSPYGDSNTGDVVFGKENGTLDDGVTFEQNYVSTTGNNHHARGGAINVMGVETFNMYGGSFTGNHADHNGTADATDAGAAFAAAGAAYFGQYASNTINFEGTVFTGNKATVAEDAGLTSAGAFGGAVRIVTGSGDNDPTAGPYITTATFDGVEFYDNVAETKGTVNTAEVAGGAVDIRGTVYTMFTDAIFGDSEGGNSAISGAGAARGGAISISQDGIVTGAGNLYVSGESSFVNNAATGVTARGGAIYSDVATNFTAIPNTVLEFEGNSATATGGDALGGAVMVNTANFANADFDLHWLGGGNILFTSNKAESKAGSAYGGAVEIGADKVGIAGNKNLGTIELFDITFDKNEAIGTASARGGGLSIAGFIIDSGSVANQTGDITANFLKFTANSTEASGSGNSRGGGLHVMGVSSFTMTDSNFTSNLAIMTGSGFAAAGAAYFGQYGDNTITLTDTAFQSNMALSTEGTGNAVGGAIRVITLDGLTTALGTEFNVSDSEFDSNAASAGSGEAAGGAIDIRGTVHALFEKTSFTNNVAESTGGKALGGAIVFSQDAATHAGSLTIIDTSFTGNSAQGGTEAYGGAIYSMEDFTVKAVDADVEFSGNYTKVGEVTTANSIYIASGATVTFDAANGKTISIQDGISGGGTVEITGLGYLQLLGVSELNNRLIGNSGILAITGTGDTAEDFSFGNTGNTFSGIVQLINANIILDGTNNANAATLANTFLTVGNDSVLTTVSDSTIGGMRTIDGTLAFGMTDALSVAGVLTVTNLDIANDVTISLDESSTLDTSKVDFFATASNVIRVVAATGTIDGDSDNVKGDTTGAALAVRNDGSTEDDGKATYTTGATLITDDSRDGNGIYLTYGLTQLEALTGKSVVVDSSKATPPATLAAKLTGDGGFTFVGNQDFSISGTANDYAGKTIIELTTADTKITAAADNVFGDPASLDIRQGTVDFGAYSQTVTAFGGSNTGAVNIGAGGTLTVLGESHTEGIVTTYNGSLSGDGDFVLGEIDGGVQNYTLRLNGTGTGFTGTITVNENKLALYNTVNAKKYVVNDGEFDMNAKLTTVEELVVNGGIVRTGSIEDIGVHVTVENLYGTGGEIVIGEIANDKFTVDQADTVDTTYAGKFTGLGQFVKAGAGDLTVTGNFENKGGITNEGAGTLTIAGNIVSAADLIQSGTGTTIITKNNTDFTGDVQLTVGTLLFANDTDNDIIFNNDITGNGRLIKADPGTLTLGGTNTHTGDTIVYAGTVMITKTGALGTGAVAIGDAGTLKLAGVKTFDNKLTNSGDFVIDLANATDKFTFGVGVGSVFAGTVELIQGTMDLDGGGNDNVAALTVATLQVDGNGNVNILSDSTIGNLTLDGGALKYASDSGHTAPVGMLTVTALTVTENGGTINTDATGGIDTTLADHDSFYDYAGDSANYQVRILKADTVVTGTNSLTWEPENGSEQARSIIGDANGLNVEVGKAVFDYTAVLSNEAGEEGIWLGYGLKEIVARDGRTVVIDSSTATDTNRLLTVKLSGESGTDKSGNGGFTFTGDKNVGVGHAASNYKGLTTVEMDAVGTTLTALSAKAFGETSGLNLKMGTVDMADFALTVDTLEGTTDSVLKIGNTLTVRGVEGRNMLFAGSLQGNADFVLGDDGDPKVFSLTLNGDNSDFENKNFTIRAGVLFLGDDLSGITAMDHLLVGGAGAIDLNGKIRQIASLGVNGGTVKTGDGDLVVEALSGDSGEIIIDKTFTAELGERTDEQDWTFGGSFSGGGDFTKTGDGNLIVSGDFSITGTIANDGGGNLDLSGYLIGSDGLEQRGSGTTTVYNTNTGFSGSVVVSDGKLVLLADNALGAYSATQSVTVGSVLELVGVGAFDNVLKGEGTIVVNQEAGKAFKFGDDVGNGFNGTLELASGTMLVDGGNAEVLAGTDLLIGNAGILQIDSDSSIIGGDLVLDADATLEFLTGGDIATHGKLTVEGDLDVSRGGRIVTGADADIDTTVIVGGFFDHSDLAKQKQIVEVKGDVKGDGGQLVWVPDPDSSTEQVRTILEGNETVGTATFDYTASLQDDGIWLGFGLKELEADEGKSIVLSTAGTGKKELYAKLTGLGGFTFTGENDATIGNAESDYKGVTIVEMNEAWAMISATSDNAFGNTSLLDIRKGIVAFGAGVSQTVGMLDGSPDDSAIQLDGTLTVAGVHGETGNFNGTMTGAGKLVVGEANSETEFTMFMGGDSSEFTGSYEINAGTLVADGPDALAGTDYTVNGGTLDLNGNVTEIAELTINGGKVSTGSEPGGVIVTVDRLDGTGGKILIGTSAHDQFVVNQSTNGSFSADIDGGGTFVNAGAGNLVASGDFSNTGGIIHEGDGELTLSGSILNGDVANHGAGNLVVSGELLGVGTLTQSGTGTTTVSGANENFSGDALVSGGQLLLTDALALGTGTIETSGEGFVSLDFAGEFNNEIGGTGNVVASGEGVIINDTTNLNMSVTGFLGGNATINSLIVENGGIVSPGNSIGTITVKTDATFKQGGIFEVEFSLDDYGKIVSNDKLIVHETVTIEEDAIIDVRRWALEAVEEIEINESREITVIETGAGFADGQLFTKSSTPRNFAFEQYIDGNDYKLLFQRTESKFAQTVESFATPNAYAVAQAMDKIELADQTAPVTDLYKALTTVDGDRNLAAAFGQLHGEVYAAARESAALMQRRFLRNLPTARDRILLPGCLPCGPAGDERWLNLWGNFNGDWLDRKGIDSYSGFDLRTAGVAVGFDQSVTPNAFAGLAFGYDNVSAKFDDINSKDKFDAFRFIAYGGWRKNDFYLDGHLGYTKDWHKAERNISFQGLEAYRAKAKGKYDDSVLSFGLEFGRKFMFGNLQLTPSVGLQYFYVDSPALTETGQSDANLYVRGDKFNSLRLPIGARLSRDFGSERFCLTPELRLFYVAELCDDEVRVATALNGVRNVGFRASSGSWGTSGFVGGFGLKGQLWNFVVARVDYDHEVYSDTNMGQVSVSVGVSW